MDPTTPKALVKHTRFRGDSKRLRFTFVDDHGAVVDPTPYVFKYAVVDDTGASLVEKLSNGGGITIASAATGAIDVQLLPADDAALPADGVPYAEVLVGQHGVTGEVHRVVGALTLAPGRTAGVQQTIPTNVIAPASPYLNALQIEANKTAAEAAATAAAGYAASAQDVLARIGITVISEDDESIEVEIPDALIAAEDDESVTLNL